VQAVKPWKHATVSMFNNEAASAERLVGPVSPAPEAPPPPAKEASALVPQKRQEAVVAADDGAGPSRPAEAVTDTYLAEKRQRKIIGIRAALQFNGYPADIIEQLLHEKLIIYRSGWSLILPNGKRVENYPQIDANPYPGGEITKHEDRKCPGCIKNFAHPGMCAPGKAFSGPQLISNVAVLRLPNSAPNQPPVAVAAAAATTTAVATPAATGLEGDAGPSQNPMTYIRPPSKASIM
jgi:hypothetical protein